MQPNAPLPAPEPVGVRSAALMLLAAALWGGNMVALKLGLSTFGPFWSAWWRMVLGTAVIVGWARSQGIDLRLVRAERRSMFTLSLLFAVQIGLLNLGADFTSPDYVAVLISANPVFTNLIGHFVVSEQRLRPARVAGLLLAFGGVCYLALGHPVVTLAPHPLAGNLLLIASSFLIGIRTVYTRWLVIAIEPVRVLVWQMVLSLPVFLAAALVREPLLLRPLSWTPVAALFYQGVLVAGFCFLVWTTLLRRHAGGTLSVFIFAIPVFGILASAAVFAEPITGRVLAATALVTTGIVLVTRPGGRPRPEPRS